MAVVMALRSAAGMEPANCSKFTGNTAWRRAIQSAQQGKHLFLQKLWQRFVVFHDLIYLYIWHGNNLLCQDSTFVTVTSTIRPAKLRADSVPEL